MVRRVYQKQLSILQEGGGGWEGGGEGDDSSRNLRPLPNPRPRVHLPGTL